MSEYAIMTGRIGWSVMHMPTGRTVAFYFTYEELIADWPELADFGRYS
jgi:hypothetical protein